MVQFGPQSMTLSSDARLLLHIYQASSLLVNLAICLRYMKTLNYNRTPCPLVTQS